jgi:hypothetical protein
MRVALASDAWTAQINGVVRMLEATAATRLSALGREVRIIRPQERLCLPCPSYPQIRLAQWPGSAPTTLWPTRRARS